MKRKISNILLIILVFIILNFFAYTAADYVISGSLLKQTTASGSSEHGSSYDQTYEIENAVINGESVDEIGNGGIKEYEPETTEDGKEKTWRENKNSGLDVTTEYNSKLTHSSSLKISDINEAK